MKKISMASMLAALSFFAPMPAGATEGGNVDFPIGVDTVLPALFPPPGKTMLLDYMQYYSIDQLAGENGQKATSGVHGNVGVNAFRLLHTWNQTWGPVSFTSGIVIPVVSLNVRTPGGSAANVAFADVGLQPLYAEYTNKSKTFRLYGGPDVYLPNGLYHKNAPVNIGLNSFTFMPIIGATWFASPRLQLSLKTTYMTSTTNHATHYHSGDSIDFDYGIDYNPFLQNKKIFVGLQGYAFQQTSGDTVHGASYMNGYYGRSFGIGPQVRYNFPVGAIVLKYQHEFAVQNRTKGDRIWVQFAVPISL